MNIKIKDLIINNFKGVKSLALTFGHITNIYGRNEAGKTTIFDAFLWLLFDKDSTDRSAFGIKNTVDTSLNSTDHEVTAILEIDSRTVTLKKVYQEKWEKKRGSSDRIFTGNEATYFWNDIPCKMADFQARLAELIKETTFKMLTNTRYFNEVMKWQDRRMALLNLAGDIANGEVIDSVCTIQNKHDFTNLIYLLDEGKTLEDIKKQVSADKTRIRKVLDQIPARVDEVKRSIPEAKDYTLINSNLQARKDELAGIDELILNESKALNEKQTAQRATQQQIYSLQRKQDAIKNKHQNDISSADTNSKQDIVTAQQNIARIKNKLSSINQDINGINTNIDNLTHKKEDLRKRWFDVDEKKFTASEDDTICPSCNQTLPEEKLEEIRQNKFTLENTFNSKKVKEKEAIELEGKGYNERIDKYKEEITSLTTQKEEVNTFLSSEEANPQQLQSNYTSPRPVEERLMELLEADITYAALNAQIIDLTATLDNQPQVNNQELLDKKRSLTSEIVSLSSTLTEQAQAEQAEIRIKQLLEEEKSLSQQLATLESTEFAAEQFTKGKMDLMESRIADKFKYVRFKLFERQVNGGEKECCETTYNNVPYKDLNTAAQVLAGLDIINTFAQEYDTYAPIFIDNRESVTWIPDTTSQVINLIVSPADKTLRIESERVKDTLFA